MNPTNEKHAAVILKCLPTATADRFLAALEPEACSAIVSLMENTEVTTDKLHAAIALLEREGLNSGVGSAKSRHRRSRGGSSGQEKASPFAFLLEYEADFLLRVINQERTRNAAIILSTLPQQVASVVLKKIRASKRVEIIRHIASLTELDASDIAELRFALRLRIQKMVSATSVGGRETETADNSDKTTRSEEALLQLAELSDPQIKKLLSRIDTSHLAPALKTLPIQLQKKVLRNMAKKPAAIVSREIVDVRIDEKHRIERSSRSVARAIRELKEQ